MEILDFIHSNYFSRSENPTYNSSNKIKKKTLLRGWIKIINILMFNAFIFILNHFMSLWGHLVSPQVENHWSSHINKDQTSHRLHKSIHPWKSVTFGSHHSVRHYTPAFSASLELQLLDRQAGHVIDGWLEESPLCTDGTHWDNPSAYSAWTGHDCIIQS